MQTVGVLQVATVAVTIRAFLLPLVERLSAKGFTVDVLAHGASGVLGQASPPIRKVFDAPWTRRPWAVGSMVKGVATVRSCINGGSYDLVHVHTPIAAFLTRWALRDRRSRAATKVIYTVHGFHFFSGGPCLQNASYLLLERLAGRWTDRLVVMNEEDLDAVQRYRIVPRDKVAFIPGVGIDLEFFSPSNVNSESVATIRKRLGLAERDSLFTVVSEFNAGKRHQDVLQALSIMRRPHAHVAFAGDGPLRSWCEQVAQRLGLTLQVHFLGFVNDVRPLIRASTATLLPSEREGLSRAAMESLALEIPVIGSAARGVRDVVGNNGVIVPVGDHQRLAEAMAWVMDNQPRAAAMGRAGRSSLKERGMDLASVLAAYERLYDEVLGEA